MAKNVRTMTAAYHTVTLENGLRCALLPVRSRVVWCGFGIHSDFERGFICAEVIKYDDFIALRSEQAVKEAGKLNIEGKDYVVQDGDIMNFRFNV